MPSGLLALFIFVVWCLWGVACVAERAAEDARRGIPKGQRGGVSLLPVIPVFPIMLLGIARLIDRVVSPWGTWIVGVAHGLFAVCLAATILRDWRCLRSLNGPAVRDR